MIHFLLKVNKVPIHCVPSSTNCFCKQKSLTIAIFGFSKDPTESKMVGSNGTMIAIRLVRSKLRKREEHSNSVHPVAEATTTVVLQTTNGSTPVATAATAQPPEINDPLAYSGQFLWAFPPPQPAQRMLYNNEQKEIVQIANSDRPGFVRGFRKNLGGRWRRLVKKKPPTDMCAIPPELKPQLKQMYVY